MKVQRYVAVTAMILVLAAQNARAEFDALSSGLSLAVGLNHLVGTPAPGPSSNGRPGAPTSTEPVEYADLLKALKEAPAASGLDVTDATALKEQGKLDVVTKSFKVAPADVQKLVNWTEFYKKYREGLNKCADDRSDKSAQATRALLDDFVGYLRATLGKEKVTVGTEQTAIAQLDERVVLAYVHAFKQVLDKKKSSFTELRNTMDPGDKQLLDMVEGTATALFGHKWTDTYTEEEFSKDVEKGKTTPIPKNELGSRIASMKSPVKMYRISELVSDAKKQIEERSKDTSASVCKPIAPPAPPPGSTPTRTATATPSRTGTPGTTATATPKPTGGLGTPAPDPGDRTPTPSVTPSVTGNPSPIESPITTPPIQPVPSSPINTENLLQNPFNNDAFNALQRNFDDQNRAVLDALREAQDAARRAQLDAQRALQDAQNANNNQRDNNDALKAALNKREDDGGQQQQPQIAPQAAIAPESGNEGPQFEPIATPPTAQGTPPVPPPPFFFPPPQQFASTGPTLPDRPLFEEGPRPLFLPNPNPQGSAALDLLRFNQEVQRQAMLAGQQRGAQNGLTLGSRLQNRPPRRLRPGSAVAGAPSRYGNGLAPSLVRRNVRR